MFYPPSPDSEPEIGTPTGQQTANFQPSEPISELGDEAPTTQPPSNFLPTESATEPEPPTGQPTSGFQPPVPPQNGSGFPQGYPPAYPFYPPILTAKQRFRKTATAIGTGFLLMLLVPYGLPFLLARFGAGELLFEVAADDHGALVFQLVFSTLMFSLPYLVTVWMQGRRFREVVNFEKPDRARFLPVVLIGFSFCMIANVVGTAFTQFLSNLGLTADMPDLPMPRDWSGVCLAFLAIAVEPALMEEFALRGVVLGSLRRYSDGAAVLISAILFAAMHGNLEQIPFAFLVGVVLGVAYVKTGSLWTGVCIHFLNNLFSLVLTYILEGGGLTTAGQIAVQSVAMIVVLALGLIGLRMLGGKEGDLFTFPAAEPQQPGEGKPTLLRWFFSSPVVIIGLVVAGLEVLALILQNLLPTMLY